ncbi:MAG: ParB/RepB/Spo0J family partition protein [Cyclobacteriaceae bacterium]
MSAKKRTGLGKGLGALLSEAPESNAIDIGGSDAPKTGISDIDIDKIEVNPFQPRTDFNQDALAELAESIKIQGIIQPITVRKLSDNAYQLISGERRTQASKLAGLDKIPAYIRTADDQQMLEMALIENIQRENLNAIEIALSYQRLMAECSLKQDELGGRVGKNRSTVTNYLRLLKLPPDIQIAIRDGRLSMGHARALISIDDIDIQLAAFQKILNEGLSVRKVEEYVRSLVNKESKAEIPKPDVDPEFVRLQDKLASHFGTRIRIKANEQNKGEINIPFSSTEDLNRILDILEV